MGYLVKAPLVQARKADGGFAHVYEGGFLPDDQDPEQLKQLLEAGAVEEADEPTEDDGEAPKRRTRK